VLLNRGPRREKHPLLICERSRHEGVITTLGKADRGKEEGGLSLEEEKRQARKNQGRRLGRRIEKKRVLENPYADPRRRRRGKNFTRPWKSRTESG